MPIDQTSPQRPVDAAMESIRPEKVAVREFWAEDIVPYFGSTDDQEVPVYLTLSGADGIDIELLINKGLIQITETGAISPGSQRYVVAVERSSRAAAQLQRKFPGLKIKDVDFSNLIAGDKLISYPNNEHMRLCRSRIINLDLQEPLQFRLADGEIVSPILHWAKKLAQLHKEPPIRSWSLYLTLNGSINWTSDVSSSLTMYLAENFKRSVKFSNDCRELLGAQIHASILQNDRIDFTSLTADDQHRILMALVPKKLCQLVMDQGWVLRTRRNLQYGGEMSRAPMVTWIFCFEWIGQSTATPDALYISNLEGTLEHIGHLGSDGNHTPIRPTTPQ